VFQGKAKTVLQDRRRARHIPSRRQRSILSESCDEERLRQWERSHRAGLRKTRRPTPALPFPFLRPPRPLMGTLTHFSCGYVVEQSGEKAFTILLCESWVSSLHSLLRGQPEPVTSGPTRALPSEIGSRYARHGGRRTFPFSWSSKKNPDVACVGTPIGSSLAGEESV
jgi:hypothetical protein